VRRPAAAVLLVLGWMTVGALSCACPDPVETCRTVSDWQTSVCDKFPAAAAGEQCPSAASVAQICGTKDGPMRAEGDKCCYLVPVSCM
jgi:hypothetical protein